MRIASAPITGPCLYGIDTPTRAELIAANYSVGEIREQLGVDTLGYLSLEGMLGACGSDGHQFCDACFSGDYPIMAPESTEQTPDVQFVDTTMV